MRLSPPWIINRKRWPREGAECESEQCSLAVVAGDAVGFELAAVLAAVDEDPLAGFFSGRSDSDGDGFELAAARAGAVAGLVVDVLAVQAGGAVVALLRTPRAAVNVGLAVDALKSVGFVSATVARTVGVVRSVIEVVGAAVALVACAIGSWHVIGWSVWPESAPVDPQ